MIQKEITIPHQTFHTKDAVCTLFVGTQVCEKRKFGQIKIDAKRKGHDLKIVQHNLI